MYLVSYVIACHYKATNLDAQAQESQSTNPNPFIKILKSSTFTFTSRVAVVYPPIQSNYLR